LDKANKLSDYDRSRVCVPNFCDCDRKSCRYQDFRKQCRSKRYLFQICNHNLFLADVNHRETGRQPLLSDYCALILDESHKLPEAAQETLTTAVSTVWNLPVGMVVTSGTLAVNADFSRFRADAELQHNGRVTESVSPSPFNYFQNCLLYLPEQPPMLVSEKMSDYYDALTAEITRLIHAAYGHTLVLFTAYSAMSAVAERLEVPYRVFTMWKNGGQALANFKAHPGAVLLATGAVWEGIDFPGDCVSLLIIPRLPFAVPDARKRRKQEAYPNLQAYIQDVVVPEMQIKLRQGFGRAIRTETDTCVIAILDDRAAPEGRYHRATLEALPETKCTSDLEDISRFMLEHKADQYFKPANKKSSP
jgi:ATP-dependent DNA helicase DinG